MKRSISLLLILVVVLSCLAACSKQKFDGGELVTDSAGKDYAVVTEADGGLARNEDGNAIVLVTNENGKNVTDRNGENVTEIETLRHGLVFGKRVEFQDYSLEIPDGWSCAANYNELCIKKTGKDTFIDEDLSVFDGDALTISSVEASLDDKLKSTNIIMKALKDANKDARVETLGIDLAGEKDCPLFTSYVDKTSTGDSVFLAYAFLERGGKLYQFMIVSTRDMTDDLGEIQSIINTIKFI